MWRLRWLHGGADRWTGRQDGRGNLRRQLKGKSNSFWLNGDRSIAVARFLCVEGGLLQWLHHQGLTIQCCFDVCGANRITVWVGCCAGCQEQSMCSCGKSLGIVGSCGKSSGIVKQQLWQRNGGCAQWRWSPGGGREGFKGCGLWVRWDSNVGCLGLRLGWLSSRDWLAGGLHQRVGG